MILVDIDVPIMGNCYDFQVEENVEIAQLIEELGEIICMKEQCRINGDPKELTLWDKRGRCVLEKNCTLADYGIHTGCSLILL